MSATVFDTPLDARSLVEASAGTGKTHALAGLFARAVIVGRLRVPQVLAVTYTIAATQELHERVRRRLQAAAELAREFDMDAPAETSGDGAETAVLRRLLHTALHDGSGESPAGLRLRLLRATREMDLAAITTIHGFCQRLLAEHALEAGQPLLAAEIVPANAAQRSALAVEAWRAVSVDAAGSEFLRRRFGDPDTLAGALRDLLAPDPLLPPAPAGEPCATRDRAWRALRTSFRDTGAAARDALQAAVRERVLSGAKDKAIPFDVLWEWFAQAGDGAPLQPHPRLACLTHDWLRGICLKDRQAQLPRLALCDAVEAYLQASDACDLARLHALRTLARARDADDKRARRSRDYDDLITAVFDASMDDDIAPRLAASLREQFPLVLVDEFQDTDARQWAIFSRLFGDGGLLLVGDPKQAIYRFRGGDVETYLAARATAQLAAPLRRNYRSRPCVLAAVNALFEHAPEDALGSGIAFVRNESGRDPSCDAHLLIDGAPAPPLSFHRVPAKPADGKPKEWSKTDSIRIAAQLCADAIRDLLLVARGDRVQRIDAGALRALQPRDCAVLVRTHGEGVAVREELARRGVPAVSAGRGSLFATTQAQSLLTLLLALATPGDDRRLRAALASPLFGLDAAALCALEEDGEALTRRQQAFAQWRQRWEQHGPQPMLAEVVARQAPRLLALADGERELTYLLQLGELMQEARAQRLGPQGQLDWLRAAIAHADGEDETQQPRLESDAGRVQILTLHASKGLEFPLVFLPFVGIGRGNGHKPDFVTYHDDRGQRVRQWRTDTVQPGALAWAAACERAQAEERAEDMRLLYVGLTRARDALWVCGGALKSSDNTALSRLLGGATPDAALRARLDGLLQWREGLPVDAAGARLASPATRAVPEARTPQRRLQRDWWIHSFSQLHRQRVHAVHAPADEAPADDERPLARFDSGPVRFGGTRFGNALHQALEHVDFARWRDAAAGAIPDQDITILRQALRDQDYPESDLGDGVRELGQLIARTLNAPLGVRAGADVRLCDIPDPVRIAELEFHFTLADADSGALLALLQARDIATDRGGFGAARLSGLMTGKIDLTCQVDGRLYVLDYKSNRLPDFAPDTLRHAMRASEYDLQALLYVVALHRWLRLRRGDGYDYARDIGGVRYLFCRGLDPAQPGQGVVAMQFDRELIEAVDRLFAPDGGRA